MAHDGNAVARHKLIEIRLTYGVGRRRNLIISEMRRLRLDRLQRGMAWNYDDLQELVAMNADQRGNKVELTLEERMRLDLRTTRCFDAPAHVVQAAYHERRKLKQREYAKLKRAADRKAKCILKNREIELFEALPDRASATELVQIAAGLPSYRDGKGKRLTGDALRKAVHRALDGLIEAGHIADEMVDAVRGLKARVVTKAQ